ncbi:vWA domain-containing protein [Pseudanabaena mucicola]|uniref:VWA domain-containing protein n=1 Tax=Pseudanabaena mucicola TaxID=71190 RepID=UPI0018F02A76|nr:VWA domain-containing protein [Pseudanabaena mucicola]
MQLKSVVQPFGEVNVYPQNNGDIDVVATILIVPALEGARVGLALDSSASMKKMYGISGVVSSFFANAAVTHNVVEPITRVMVKYLANFAVTGKVDLINWACGAAGTLIEDLGSFSGEEIDQLAVKGPNLPWGTGTKLLPTVQYFVDKYQDSPAIGVKHPAAICLIITDGTIDDLEDVKEYCFQYALEIADRTKPFIKFVLLGVGKEIAERQLEELDNLFENSFIKDAEGRDIDLWDYQVADEIQTLEQIFKEFVSMETIVTNYGRILNQEEVVCEEYNFGVPALMRFKLPAGSTSFTLEFSGGNITQDITEALPKPSDQPLLVDLETPQSKSEPWTDVVDFV